MILGIDEVGRGPWAGPLVVGAVVLGGVEIDGLADSKKLSKKKREELAPLIYERAQAVGLGWVDAHELDIIGMSEALRLATRRAVEKITVPYHEIIIDGTINLLDDTTKAAYVTTLPKADALIPSVSAASIVAKVARDAFMAEQDALYPGYGFGSHSGYGVEKHRKAIEKYGVTPLHRLSFAPLKKYGTRPMTTAIRKEDATNITTKKIGDESESVAALYLSNQGHRILERNWRTRWCEIDIVSEYNNTYYFTEVKHRKNDALGDGLAAITPKKMKQMAFAATLFASSRSPKDLCLAVIATTGVPPIVVDFLELS
ncbi:ribonuclease HII [Microbacteriaceae bacterium]|nr:ribonuclease HII [Candidatus Saccharibacteria bacterium]